MILRGPGHQMIPFELINTLSQYQFIDLSLQNLQVKKGGARAIRGDGMLFGDKILCTQARVLVVSCK